MGKYFIDKYSTYHLCSGIIAYYCGLSFTKWFILHAIYEMAENTRLQKELDKIELSEGITLKSVLSDLIIVLIFPYFKHSNSLFWRENGNE